MSNVELAPDEMTSADIEFLHYVQSQHGGLLDSAHFDGFHWPVDKLVTAGLLVWYRPGVLRSTELGYQAVDARPCEVSA